MYGALPDQAKKKVELLKWTVNTLASEDSARQMAHKGTSCCLCLTCFVWASLYFSMLAKPSHIAWDTWLKSNICLNKKLEHNKPPNIYIEGRVKNNK